jgi:hypothetical protein
VFDIPFFDGETALSAIYDSIKIVASAVVGAIFALAIRENFSLNKEVTGLSIAAVGLALFCSYQSRRLKEAEKIKGWFISTPEDPENASGWFIAASLVAIVAAILIALRANQIGI